MLWFARHRLIALALICAVCTGVIIAAAMFRNLPFADSVWANEITFRDALARKARRTAIHPEFVFLGIDEPSKKLDQVSEEEVASSPVLQAMRNGYPWSRDVHAALVERLCAAGARLIIFDVMFDRDRPGDEQFAAALERHRDRVVIGANIATGRDANTGSPEITIVPPNRTLIPDQLADDRVGYINFWPDGDGRIRKFNYTVSDAQLVRLSQGDDPGVAGPWDTQLESFDSRALRKLGRDDRIPPDGASRMIRFGPDHAYAPRSFFEVFVPAIWERNYGGGSFFKDKIVLVGSSSAVDHDVHPTPISDNTSGPLLHFHALAAALDGEFLSETSRATNLALLLAAGSVAWLLVASVRNPLGVMLLQVLATGGYLGAALFLQSARGVYLLTLPVLGAFNISALFSLGYDFMRERIEKLRTRRTLERYVSRNLVKEILDNPASYYNSMRGVRQPATMLFSDIVGFTALTERADPVQLVTQLNEYLTRMVGVVFQNGGTLDKFIGDAVMAVWGNVSSRGVAEDAKLAARTALGMRRELVALNERWHRDGSVPLAIGIGINQGDVLIGNIGSSGEYERLDPTVIGDAVNLASRLEALTRTYAVDILVGPTASELIRDAFHLRSVARVQVKNKSEAVEITTLIGARDEPLDPEFLRALEIYEEGFRAFRNRQFAEAKQLFTQFLSMRPNDFLAKMYLERAAHYEEEPPDEHWTAAEVFTKK
ncbi:MAG: adenylate/guanylate cyclase domain-containing protein [Verrucomicrobiota bacterium]|nr:adenylate/guanylate cyclase domain-containing protein [Verrucomicrobiota bacterium]